MTGLLAWADAFVAASAELLPAQCLLGSTYSEWEGGRGALDALWRCFVFKST